MSNKLRLFIAVHFSREVLDGLSDLQQRLRGRLEQWAPIKWVAPGNLHLTLQFLGDVGEGLVPKLAGSLNGGYSDLEAFQVDLAGVGAFPKPNRPKVIWVDVRHGADGLRALHAATLRVTESFGFEQEKQPFKSHVTLGRIRAAQGQRPPDLSKPLAGVADLEVGKCQIDQVHLVKSILKPTGPMYSILDSFPVGE